MGTRMEKIIKPVSKTHVKKKRILITGSTGLVGSYFCRLTVLKKYRLYTLVHSVPAPTAFGTRISVDLSTSTDLFRLVLNKAQPDIIVHLAAMTDVERCEIQKNTANHINHLAVRELVDYVVNNNPDCFILLVSTDYVFDGEKGCYDETDKTNPINWYGKTKLLAEQELLHCRSDNWCIARTSTPFGIHTKKSTFPSFVIKNLSQHNKIKVLTDQITSPTYAFNLADMLFEIIESKIKGIVHASGSSKVSRFDQAVMIAKAVGLDKNLIKPTTIDQMGWKARRPRDSSLDVGKAYNTLAKKPMRFKESLSKFAAELK
jgi:dTDP-4-dehydrorhamnose reductase